MDPWTANSQECHLFEIISDVLYERKIRGNCQYLDKSRNQKTVTLLEYSGGYDLPFHNASQSTRAMLDDYVHVNLVVGCD